MRTGYENGYRGHHADRLRRRPRRAEEHDNAITYDYPMFSKPMTAAEFAGTLAGADAADASRGY